MLFHSFPFLFAFLPLAWLGLRLAAPHGARVTTPWLLVCSLFFYAYWRIDHLWIIVFSISLNFICGRFITQNQGKGSGAILAAGILADLALLGWFKYHLFLKAVFTLGWGSLAGTYANPDLPIGISFFTFTQIAFLADCRRRKAAGYDPAEYGLFVTVFPHLLAGPIIHHAQIAPQLRLLPARLTGRFYVMRRLIPGLALLSMGLIKKVLLADSLGEYVAAPFSLVAGEHAGFVSAWGGALAYTLQIYFDFSGYSDMAVGVALILGLRLPVNFRSPYKAASIIDFWRRWHITLSQFLRDYLYVPLGGNRHGAWRRHGNLITVMLLGGLWHGANWTFVVWGGIHGAALIVNHMWRTAIPYRMPGWAGVCLTLAIVVPAWVPFRADDMTAAIELYSAMIGLNGIILPGKLVALAGDFAPILGLQSGPITRFGGAAQAALIVIGAAIALFSPNSMELIARTRIWRSRFLPIALGAGLALALLLIHVRESSTFLYFQF